MTILSPIEVDGGNSPPSSGTFHHQSSKMKKTTKFSSTNPDDVEGDTYNRCVVRWCWKESKSKAGMHPPYMIYRDNDKESRFIFYDEKESREIEKAWKAGSKEYYLPTASTNSAGAVLYRIDFEAMKQVNEQTGYKRSIKRITVPKNSNEEEMDELPFETYGTAGQKCLSSHMATGELSNKTCDVVTQKWLSSVVVAENSNTDGPYENREFVASKQFEGSKNGYVFRMGANGLGYYVDITPRSHWAPDDMPEFGGMDFVDPKDIPAYTCTCREQCRHVLKAEESSRGTATTVNSVDFGTAEDDPTRGPTTNVNTLDRPHLLPPAACNRRHFCNKCRRYAHECCLTNELCQKCHDKCKTTTGWSVGLLNVARFSILMVGAILLFYLVFAVLFLVLPPFGIYHALFTLPEERKNEMEYLEDGIEIDGFVTRRWTYEVSDGDGGTRTVHQCSIAYCFPEEPGIYRLDFARTPSLPDTQWSGMYEGSKVQLVALEGCPKSARIPCTIRPWSSTGLLVRRLSLATISVGYMLILPILFHVWSQPSEGPCNHPYLETNRWVSVLMYCILGIQLMMTTFLCLKPFVFHEEHCKKLQEKRASSTKYSSTKAGDLSSQEPNQRATMA